MKETFIPLLVHRPWLHCMTSIRSLDEMFRDHSSLLVPGPNDDHKSLSDRGSSHPWLFSGWLAENRCFIWWIIDFIEIAALEAAAVTMW
jgi:hypothetical protein